MAFHSQSDPSLRSTLLDQMDRHDYRLILLLAGVHALTRQQIANLRLDELDLTGNRFHVGGRPRPLDRLTREHLLEWRGHLVRRKWPPQTRTCW